MRIIANVSNDMPVKDLPQRELGIITKWGGKNPQTEYVGLFVIRHENKLIAFNTERGDNDIFWENITTLESDYYRVLVLAKGTRIEL